MFTSVEVQDCIDFQQSILRDMGFAIKMAGGGPMVEMAAAIGVEKHTKTLEALKEYKSYLVTKELLEDES